MSGTAVMATSKHEAELEQRRQELQFLGTQWAMSGVEAPASLAEEYAEVLAALEQVRSARAARAPVGPR